LLPGCRSPSVGATAPIHPSTARSASSALFEDVAAQAGVRFTHSSGATGKFYFVENTPGGCAFLDYDNDGFLDILLIQSGPSGPPDRVTQGDTIENRKSKIENPKRPHCALYHNNGDGTFTDVTAGSGLDRDLGYAQGVAVGDYDNDGYEDLFITSFGGNHLFHNELGRRKTPATNPQPPTPIFKDVTHKMGLDRVHSTGYATSAAFGDYNNDGRLDLYVCYYTSWTWERDRPCRDSDNRLEYCTPELYEPDTHRLYRNDGDRFTDVSEQTGIAKAKGRGLSVVFVDYDGDGKQDIFVADDLTPNILWRNNGDGTFTNVALETGCAYDGSGALLAGMGIGVADYDHSGQESLFVGNFSDKPNTLYKNTGTGLFRDESMASGLAMPHMKFLTFGCEFLDYDADGWPDLIVANGHVQVHADLRIENVTYKERKQLFHNERNGVFREITDPGLMGDLMTPTLGRGLAVGDYDNDGRLDVLVNNQNGPAQLFHNRDRSPHHWVSFKTVGTKSNRDGIHAHFILLAGGMKQTATVRGGSSYLSASDRRVYFGLGSAARVEQVEIRWPSGTRDVLKDVAADTPYVVTEGKGITVRLPAARSVSK
jgi:hypothetical protein